MKHDPIKTSILSIKSIARASPALLKALNAPAEYESIGLITTDCDDVSYAALDEATKKAQVRVAYARSMYAGSANASGKLAGEFIGVLVGRNPSEVASGLEAAARFIECGASFYSADDEDRIVYFAHCISRSGSYLSAQAKVPEGTPIAYLIASPLEAVFALDRALKTAQVEMKVFYGPPTETNFAGALLTGDQAACRAACEAFAEGVLYVGEHPLDY